MSHMTTHNTRTHHGLVAILPAPEGPLLTGQEARGSSTGLAMKFACLTCVRRKVKCDKAVPTCSSCRKSALGCLYQTPQPRRQKRKLGGDVDERIARYESILRENKLLPQDVDASPATEETPATPPRGLISLQWNESETAKPGKLLAGPGKSRYINSTLWRALDDDHMSDEGEGSLAAQPVTKTDGNLTLDPLTGAFMGCQQNLLQFHPPYVDATSLWQAHVENVEPLCKILHIPLTTNMVALVSKQPVTASKADECLLFAIYHFAVYSMTDEQCSRQYRQSRDTLLPRYRFAAQQALVNASFLKTTDISVLQALVLFLIPCRNFFDTHTYWILTGVAVRIAQRIGIHRDGTNLGLLPFDVQMRRRLFYQLLPLDGNASQMAGTGLAINMPHDWDTQPPLNINDDQIWPGLAELPDERRGATDMTFCLARSYMGRLLGKAGGAATTGAVSGQYKDDQEAETMISKAEDEAEGRFIRYCNIANPLHLLTIGMLRSGIATMRLRIRLSKARSQTITQPEMKQAFHLALKIVEIDVATYSQPGVSRYRWYTKPFFVWGLWESLVFLLNGLWKPDYSLSPAEIDEAWDKAVPVYSNHDEILESKQPLHVALGRLTLKAWDARPPSTLPEPEFIRTLRSRGKGTRGARIQDHNSSEIAQAVHTGMSTNLAPPAPGPLVVTEPLPGDLDLGTDNDLDFDPADWMFWDQLIQDQAQGG